MLHCVSIMNTCSQAPSHIYKYPVFPALLYVSLLIYWLVESSSWKSHRHLKLSILSPQIWAPLWVFQSYLIVPSLIQALMLNKQNQTKIVQLWILYFSIFYIIIYFSTCSLMCDIQSTTNLYWLYITLMSSFLLDVYHMTTLVYHFSLNSQRFSLAPVS